MDRTHPVTNQVLETRIRQEEIRMLYGSMPFSVLATVSASLIVFITLFGHVENTDALILWLAVMLVSILLRALDTYSYHISSAVRKHNNMWGWRFLLGATFAGIWWGMLAWLGYSSRNEYLALIVICIVGVAGGSMSTLSYRWQTIAFFLMPALSLLELKLLLIGGAFSGAISTLLAVFILFTLSTSRRIYQNTNQNVRLRIEANFREQALMAAKNEAVRASQAKSRFLSSMSHEFRTPLNAILGFSQLLQYDEHMDESRRMHIHEINSAGKHLLELVNQILDLAKIEDGNLQVNLTQVPLGEVIYACQSLIKPLAQEKQIQLHFYENIDGHVRADRTRLKQVILNLLTNAIKYNHHFGSVYLRCAASAPNRIRIEIEDSGHGIPQSIQHKLFQPFQRLESEATQIEGTGIGLSIAKQLTEMMHGSIGCISMVGEGSTFWIELDGTLEHSLDAIPATTVTLDAASESSQVTAHSSISTSGALRILVVEDNITNQKLIVSQLKALGYMADIATQGEQALELYRNQQYQLIITDCNMPVMDGYALAQAIRRGGDTRTPIIALTADAFPESATKCQQAGINDRIIKPVTLKTLRNTIHKWTDSTVSPANYASR